MILDPTSLNGGVGISILSKKDNGGIDYEFFRRIAK